MMLKWQFGGAVPKLIIMMHFVRPAIPAPASTCLQLLRFLQGPSQDGASKWATLLFALVFRIGTLRSCLGVSLKDSLSSKKTLPLTVLSSRHHCHKRAYFNGISESSPGAVALCYGHMNSDAN